jgi:hypothetical protein
MRNAAAVGCRIACAVWQSEQTGASSCPRQWPCHARPPCNRSSMPAWHFPHVAGMFTLYVGLSRILVAQNVMRSVAAHGSSPPPAGLPCSARIRESSPCTTDIRWAGRASWPSPRCRGIARRCAERSADTPPTSDLSWENGVRVAMATGARVIRPVRMHAANQARRFIGVACGALHRRYLLRVRISLDVAMAVRAFQASVNAQVKLLRIYADAVPRPILHPGVAMAAQAVCLRLGYSGIRQGHKQASEKSGGNEGNGFHGVSGQFLPIPGPERKASWPFSPASFFQAHATRSGSASSVLTSEAYG